MKKAPISIGTLPLGSIPRVVGIVDRLLPSEKILRLRDEGVDILEIRFDLFAGDLAESIRYVEALRRTCRCPLIGTLRETPENRDTRKSLLSRIIPCVDCIDIETECRFNAEVAAEVHDAGKTVIISEHDFAATPDSNRLSAIEQQARVRGADIVKIAVTPKSREDVTRLLRFTEECPGYVVTIAMGKLGTISRLVAPLFGSLFSYGFIEGEVAPGQMQVEELTVLMNRLFPERKR